MKSSNRVLRAVAAPIILLLGLVSVVAAQDSGPPADPSGLAPASDAPASAAAAPAASPQSAPTQSATAGSASSPTVPASGQGPATSDDPAAGAASQTPANADDMLPTVVVSQKARPKPPPPDSRKASPQASAAPAPTAAPSNVPAAPLAASATPQLSSAASKSTPETPMSRPLNSTSVGGRAIDEGRPATSDTASLLKDVPGVSIAQGGGVSGLPTIDGLADDRVKIIINGRETTSACANHMNPPLSYADPAQVKRITVVPGVTPVSAGGDSLGGTIVVETLPPAFAEPGQDGLATHGSLSAAYRTNGHGMSGGASASAASGNVSVAYTGAWTRAESYEDGGGASVGSTDYQAKNHTLALAARDGDDTYVLEAGFQHIPYQGFVNQPMDMVLNEAWNVGARYDGTLDWGRLSLRAYHQDTIHEMNFLDDKQRSFAAIGWGDNWTMPMNTHGQDTGYALKVDVPVAVGAIVRLGNELHYQTLEDWWPAVCDTPYCGMGPLDYHNIHDGERLRVGTFLEWEQDWGRGFSTLIGARNDVVSMNTGDAQPYDRIEGDPDSDAADIFNAAEHKRTDVNFDVSALVRYDPRDDIITVEAGYARKTRSPNLYERYAWGQSTMTSQMVTWFGDSNGYYGNLDLDPEMAHRVSLTLGLHDRGREAGEIKVTPYYTYVDDFITAELVAPVGWVNGFNQLQFVNHDAVLYGVDVTGRVVLADGGALGRLALSGVGGFVHGEDRETGNPLYHMMPWNGRVALEHKIGGWTGMAEVQMVDGKTRVDEDRLEPETAGYALFNLRTSYEWDSVRLDLGVENVFDTLYLPPLGGTNYTDYLMPGHAVAGAGRSFYSGLKISF